MGRAANTLAEILAKTVTCSSTGCLLWQGSRASDGRYGCVSYKDATYRTHRLVYQLYYGEEPGKKNVLHTCDTPLCVNPKHLFLGTNRDNVNDKVAKRRQAKGIGCRHPHRVLDAQAVVDIRKLRSEGWKILDLAARFKCCKDTILNVLKGRTWRHV